LTNKTNKAFRDIIRSNQFYRIFGFSINSYLLIFNLVAILDEEEFGEAATNVEYDGDNLNSAEELGLLVSNQNDMILN
jgi:hypothetical protein